MLSADAYPRNFYTKPSICSCSASVRLTLNEFACGFGFGFGFFFFVFCFTRFFLRCSRDRSAKVVAILIYIKRWIE